MGTNCYAEFGMTGANDSTAWQTCLWPELTICEFVVGDGVGGSESYVGDANGAQECVQLVLDTSTEANGATFSATGASNACYAEFGMTGANDSTSWQTCMFTLDNGLSPTICQAEDMVLDWTGGFHVAGHAVFDGYGGVHDSANTASANVVVADPLDGCMCSMSDDC